MQLLAEAIIDDDCGPVQIMYPFAFTTAGTNSYIRTLDDDNHTTLVTTFMLNGTVGTPGNMIEVVIVLLSQLLVTVSSFTIPHINDDDGEIIDIEDDIATFMQVGESLLGGKHILWKIGIRI